MSSVDTALRVAHRAVDHAERHLREHGPGTVAIKADRDLVTAADVAVEHLVRAELRAATPAIGFLGEETGGDTEGLRWVLDPIDGTTNCARGLPLHAIALALVDDDRPVLGVVTLSALGHRYWASVGHGAWRDGQPITVSTAEDLSAAVVAVGDYGTGPAAAARNRADLALHAHLAPRAHRVRMLGTAAVDLVWVADGTLDASITLGNRPWDMAAGAVIAREAGALVLDADGTDHSTAAHVTVATTPGLRAAVLAAVADLDIPPDPTRWAAPC